MDERWTMSRRRDWPHDHGSLVEHGAPAPEPDDLLDVFEVVPLRAVRDVIRDAGAAFAGTGSLGDLLIAQALFQALTILEQQWPPTRGVVG